MADGKMVTSIIIVVIIYVVAIVFFILGYVNQGYFNECDQDESTNCFQITCQGSTATCDYYAYRCDGEGKARCSYNPSTVVDVITSDGICTGTS